MNTLLLSETNDRDRIVIPNECKGSKISPCGRNDREVNGDNVSNVTKSRLFPLTKKVASPLTTQSLEGEAYRFVCGVGASFRLFRSHIEEYRLILALKPNVESIDGQSISILSISDQCLTTLFVLDRR